MSDWTKTVLTLITGILVGVILEPLKHWVGTYFAAWRARKAIYGELGDIYYSFVLLNDGVPEYYKILLSRFTPSAFQFYYDMHREAFYRLNGWQYLVGFYESLQGIKREVLEGRAASQIEGQIRNEFEFRFKSGQMDKRFVLDCANKIQKERRAAMKRVTQ
jgi:hypothetical protein